MCQTADNSLKGNLKSQIEMLRSGVVTLDRMPELMSKAEDAERMHLNLMKQSGWTPEQLFLHTGYNILLKSSLTNH